ncbi:MAG: alpha/beta hydrolase [Flavobacteriales bacterium]|nr:alpha/beta hydrolase [Flavobacteriales bacterium]
MPFPSIVVASTNDHVTSIDRSKKFASDWGSELIVLDNAGHIEPKSGFGEWPLGIQLLHKLENTSPCQPICDATSS